MGFERIAYKGLETGSRDFCSHVVKQNNIVFCFTSPLNPIDSVESQFVKVHGDAVRDVAMLVDDARKIWKNAVDRGAKSVREPKEYKDKNGTVIMASLQTYGDCIHTLVQNINYSGPFLPGFVAVDKNSDPLSNALGALGLEIIDHVVGNQGDGKMIEVADWYSTMLDFHQFWSVDDTQVHTEYSALRSIVMCDYDRIVKMPINEPAAGTKRGKSQIQEYIDYHGGAGVQHIALRTRNIIKAVTKLKERGVRFLDIPPEYYDDLRIRLKDSPVVVKEDLSIIEKLNILVDFDDRGYLLQIFTEPVEDRPTLFYEVIQRNNHDGFGAGNFKALFTSIERAQDKRGNLHSKNTSNALERIQAKL
jgi:4-hydroxyphenylpyruvate dioxygenase